MLPSGKEKYLLFISGPVLLILYKMVKVPRDPTS
jgi:hypothetical protein